MQFSTSTNLPKRLAYLSAAPRVSTRPEAEATGPKSHVIGVLRAFENLGWEVQPFIVGDRVPEEWIRSGSGQQLSTSILKRIAADLLRIGMNYQNRRVVLSEIESVDWAYERFSAFQSLGRAFQKHSIPWILETNAPLFHEAKFDRQSLQLSGLARFLELRAYRECDVLVCISQTLKEIVVQEARISPDKVIVMPNGVDPTRFDPQKVVMKRIFNLPTIGFVGKLIKWQALDLLIQVLSELKTEDINFGLVIVGDGPARSEWEAFAVQIGLQDRIHFTGRVKWENVPSYISGFDIGYSGQIATSSGQMYLSPLKLYEYLSMEKPVVASAFEDARNLIQEGHGYLFTPGNKESLKNVLRNAYAHHNQWADMGRKSRGEILQSHSWEARVTNLIGQVQIILERGKSGNYGRSLN